jgi:hypothetical protein
VQKKNYVELISCFVAGCCFNNRIHELFVCLLLQLFVTLSSAIEAKEMMRQYYKEKIFFGCQSTNPESVPCRAPVWVPIWGANLDLSFSFHAKLQVFNKVSQSEHQTSKMNIKFQKLRKFEGCQTYPT